MCCWWFSRLLPALRRATVILNEAEELVEAAKNAGQPLTGRFRLGVIPTVAPFLLPRVLPLLRTAVDRPLRAATNGATVTSGSARRRWIQPIRPGRCATSPRSATPSATAGRSRCWPGA